MVYDVLRVVNPVQVLTGDAQPLGPLGPHGDEDPLKAQGEKVLQGQIALPADEEVAVVGDEGVFQDATELSS